MPQELFPNIFREKIPLPNNPLKAVNSYILKGDGRFLIIDTAFNSAECLEAMRAYLSSLNVDLDRSDFFITHYHVDHLGLVSSLRGKTSNVYLGQADFEKLCNPNYHKDLEISGLLNGFPRADMPSVLRTHPSRQYQTRVDFMPTPLGDGEMLSIGDYSLKCVDTPGHSQGHRCLYEPHARILFAGDHILQNISPNISLWSRTDDALGVYFQSLDKILTYDIDLILPGHREPFRDYKKRIEELKEHHESRNDELIAVLQKGKLNAYQAASRMSWSVKGRQWEDFPLSQKWFAVGETMAHLHYLAARGRVKKIMENEKIFYCTIA